MVLQGCRGRRGVEVRGGRCYSLSLASISSETGPVEETAGPVAKLRSATPAALDPRRARPHTAASMVAGGSAAGQIGDSGRWGGRSQSEERPGVDASRRRSR